MFSAPDPFLTCVKMRARFNAIASVIYNASAWLKAVLHFVNQHESTGPAAPHSV